MSELIIKGQPWICDNKVLQDQIIFRDGEDCGNIQKVLISDIWKDLLSAGTYKWNGKNFFYWEIDATDTGSDGTDIVKFKLECPKLTYQVAKEYLLGCGKPEYLMTDEEKEDMNAAEIEASKNGKFPFGDPRKKSLGKGEYLDYWITKFIEAHENAARSGVIQRSEIIFPGTSYIDTTGKTVNINQSTISNNDMGDLMNLISIF